MVLLLLWGLRRLNREDLLHLLLLLSSCGHGSRSRTRPSSIWMWVLVLLLLSSPRPHQHRTTGLRLRSGHFALTIGANSISGNNQTGKEKTRGDVNIQLTH